MFLSYITVLALSLRSEMEITHFKLKEEREARDFLSLLLDTCQLKDMVKLHSELKSGAHSPKKGFFFPMTKIKLENKLCF